MTRKKIDVFGLVLTSACLLWAIILCITDFDWWTFGGTLFVAGLIVLTWILIRRSKPVDHDKKDGHTEEICDNCDPIQMRDGGPVTNIVWWYAADRKITRVHAEDSLDNCSPHTRDVIQAQHAAYLKLDKFRNYPRP
jgi:hypothetical protein